MLSLGYGDAWLTPIFAIGSQDGFSVHGWHPAASPHA
jgi:hypothetical protein